MAGQSNAPEAPPRPGPDLDFASHEVRLSGRQWLVTAAVLLVVFVATPPLWGRYEGLDPDPDCRLPYALGTDYWLFSRLCSRAASQGKTVLIGDSVVWAQYVAKDQTLSHFLNEQAGDNRFANLGLDGSHPAALAGLIEHYAGAVSGRKVILHCNPLWMSSPKHDLSSDEPFRFNHPRLVPQFVPRIDCYRETSAEKLSAVVEREVPFLAWTNHVRMAYFEQSSVPAWTLKHPYRCPLKALAGPPEAGEKPQHEPISWTARGLSPQDFAWVALDQSFQWRSFRRAVRLLRERDNDVFVLVGPFNEHMLQPASRERYERMKAGIAAWLTEQGVAHSVPAPLASELYADASHPLKEGYALLAARLYEDEAFTQFIGGGAR